MKMYLKQGQPISLKYEMGSQEMDSLGEVIFLLAPKVEDDDYPEAPAAATVEPPQPSKKRERSASPVQRPGKHAKAADQEEYPSLRMSPVGDVGVWHEADDAEEPVWD